MMAPVPRGRARTLAPAEQTDFQPSWPPGLTAQRPLSTLRKPHPEKNNTYFFQHLPESTMTPRQEVWKLVAKGPKGVCILGLRVAADLSLLLSRAWCRAALWEVLPMLALLPAGFAHPVRSTLCTSLLPLVPVILSHQPADLHHVSGAAIFSILLSQNSDYI